MPERSHASNRENNKADDWNNNQAEEAAASIIIQQAWRASRTLEKLARRFECEGVSLAQAQACATAAELTQRVMDKRCVNAADALLGALYKRNADPSLLLQRRVKGPSFLGAFVFVAKPNGVLDYPHDACEVPLMHVGGAMLRAFELLRRRLALSGDANTAHIRVFLSLLRTYYARLAEWKRVDQPRVRDRLVYALLSLYRLRHQSLDRTRWNARIQETVDELRLCDGGQRALALVNDTLWPNERNILSRFYGAGHFCPTEEVVHETMMHGPTWRLVAEPSPSDDVCIREAYAQHRRTERASWDALDAAYYGHSVRSPRDLYKRLWFKLHEMQGELLVLKTRLSPLPYEGETLEQRQAAVLAAFHMGSLYPLLQPDAAPSFEVYVDALDALLPRSQQQQEERNVIRKLEALNERIRHARIAMLNGVLTLCMPTFAADGFAASARSRLPSTLPAAMELRLRGFAKPLIKTPDASFREYAASLAFVDAATTAEETAWFRLDAHRLADMRARAKQLLELTMAHYAIVAQDANVRELLKTRITALLAQPSPMTGVPAWLPPFLVNKACDMHAAWARVVRVAWGAHGQRISHVMRG